MSITPTQRWHIRERWKAGEDPHDLAGQYNVSIGEITHEIEEYKRQITQRNAVPAPAPGQVTEEPRRGLRCETCRTISEWAKGEASLVPGIVLHRCPKCGRKTAHRQVETVTTTTPIRSGPSVVTSTGDHRRDRGMGLAEGAVAPEWSEKANREVETLAGLGVPFTADDLIEAVGMPEGHPNAVGPVFAAASRRGLIEQVGWRKAAGRASQQSRRLAVWRGRSNGA